MPMTVNTAWLLEYLDGGATHEELLDALPRLGLEIEERHDLRDALAPVRIGFVRKKEPLAGAPGMYACEIEIERGRVVTVVCASEHEVQAGWGVPVAPAGSVLPTGKAIRAEQFHGVRSLGMICLDGEMGLVARGTGMQHFTDERALGLPLPEVSEIRESLVELNVLPNRPDFLGVVGIAREIAALLRLGLRYPDHSVPAPSSATAPLAVEILDPAACPRYMGAVVRGVRVAPSPPWLKARLLLAGMRPINNVVDITNYVMYEWGQPLHAFDYRTIRGGTIIVRRMAPGESLELLTGKVLTLGEKTSRGAEPPLVIADTEGPVALAGVMGGGPTQTAERTTDILIEAAHFDPVTIRRAVQQVDLGTERKGTDSSYRFERGTDPNLMLVGAMKRAIRLVTDIAGGALAGPIVDQYAAPRSPRTFRLTPERTSSYLGTPIDGATIRDCLTRLSMATSGPDEALDVQVPTWRADANDPVVLIEDVARMVGYDRVPVAPQRSRPTLGGRAPADRVRQAVSDRLVAAGFYECRNPSLESPKESRWLGDPDDSLVLTNWATQEMSVLRRTLLPALVSVVQRNVSRGAGSVRFFEVDRAFGARADEIQSGEAMHGTWRVAAVAGGRLQRSNWRSDAAQVDLFTFKGMVEDVLDGLGARQIDFQPADFEPFLPGTSATVVIGTAGRVGVFGELDRKRLGLDRVTFPLFAVELDIEPLEKLASVLPSYQATGRLPAVTRDLALVVSDQASYADLDQTIRENARPTLESLRLVDVYKGQQVPPGHQSLAFHLVFRDPERTLTAEEVATTMAKVVEALGTRFQAVQRG